MNRRGGQAKKKQKEPDRSIRLFLRVRTVDLGFTKPYPCFFILHVYNMSIIERDTRRVYTLMADEPLSLPQPYVRDEALLPKRQPKKTYPKGIIGQKERTAARRTRAMELRIEGKSMREIADWLEREGYGWPTVALVSKDVALTLRNTIDVQFEQAEKLRALELERLDKMQSKLWLDFVGEGATPPNLSRSDQILRLMQHRAKLLGLYAPEQSLISMQSTVEHINRTTSEARTIIDNPDAAAQMKAILRGLAAPIKISKVDPAPEVPGETDFDDGIDQ